MMYRMLRSFGCAALVLVWVGGAAAGDDGLEVVEGETHEIANETVSGEGEWSFELSSFNQMIQFRLKDGDPDTVLGYSINWDGQEDPITGNSEDTRTNEELIEAQQVLSGEFVITVYGGDNIETEIVVKHPADYED